MSQKYTKRKKKLSFASSLNCRGKKEVRANAKIDFRDIRSSCKDNNGEIFSS